MVAVRCRGGAPVAHSAATLLLLLQRTLARIAAIQQPCLHVPQAC